MFLVERLASPPSPRADLMPRQLFAGSGDLVRATLMARPAPEIRSTARLGSQLDLALPQPRGQRKAG